MKKKQAPEQYAAKPKNITVKPGTTLSVHPAAAVAQGLVRWLERDEVPPSVILLHGLYLARSPKNDGLPVDTFRPQLQMQGTDSKTISEILDALARPQAVKTQVIAAWLQSIWVRKAAGTSWIASSQKERETSTHPNNPATPIGKIKDSSSTKPVIVVKKKRQIRMKTA